jgi:DNA-directed RNA polymerase subunit RPC12/RpoP
MGVGFCTECGLEIESFEGLNECPECGTRGVPCSRSQDVEVKINWHELRILVMWAERWAHECITDGTGGPSVVYAIANRLRMQFPDMPPLSLNEEFAKLKDEGIEVRTNMPEAMGEAEPLREEDLK